MEKQLLAPLKDLQVGWDSYRAPPRGATGGAG